MGAGRKLRGKPDFAEVLLVEAIRLIIDQNRHYPEIHPALIAQIESFPCKAEGCFIPNAS
jgi:hypothetical protein